MSYHRSLLNFLPSWEFTLFLFSVLLVASLVFYIIARKVFPKLLTETMSPAFGVMGTSFGFILGFSIAILWQNYTAATKSTIDEGTSFNVLINNISALKPEDQLKMIGGIETYIDILKTKEWPAMSQGTFAPEAWSAFNNLYAIMRSITPTDLIEMNAYSDMARQLDSIGASRTSRLQEMNPMLDLGIRLVIILGAFFIIYSVAVNDTKNKLNHIISMVVVCFLLAFNVGVAFILAYPFSGTIGIKGTILLEDVPIRLEHRKARLKNAAESKSGTMD